MRFIILENKVEVGKYVGQLFLDEAKKNPHLIMGLATGSSPLETYQFIAENYRSQGVSFAEAKSFNLDEYLNCPIKKETYRSFMEENLFSKIDIKTQNTNFPDPDNPEHYDQRILEAGGVDIQLLGIGQNGHIGFNEPGTSFSSLTHIIELTKSTREANKRFFGGDLSLVPTEAVSMGLATIMKSRHIVLIANDITKIKMVEVLLKGLTDETYPMSVLNSHPNCDIVLTRDIFKIAFKAD